MTLNMNVISRHCKTLVIAAKPLPLVVRESALLKRWLLNPAKSRIILFAGLLLYLVLATQLSQAIVDAWHPLNQNSLKTGIMELVNSPILRKLQNLRETRYWQVLSLFWVVGLSAASIVLILDLPRSIEAAGSLPIENKKAGANADSDEILKTRAVFSAEKKVRFVGPDRRYRINKAIASGGSGIVYQAEDTVLGRKVALKELLEDLAGDKAQSKRFKSEARALALLNHAHILPVYDLLEENGRFWLVMELLNGGTLKDRIEVGVLNTDQSIEIVRGLAAALETAHQNGFVHRDIKPENILFTDEGSFRITDFGIAKHRSTGIKTSHGLILGSPGYMSPEQAAGEPVDARSDIYSLGITMFQMMTAELPFQGDVSSVMAQHITKPVPLPSTINPDVENALDKVFLKMVAKSPGERFQTMAELIKALDNLN